MADNFPVADSSLSPHNILTDELTTVNGGDVSTASPRIHAQRVKLMVGADGIANDVSSTNPINISASDGQLGGVGTTTDTEVSTGNGSVIAILKRLRTLLAGGLPAALTGSGNLKTAIVESTATVSVAGGTNVFHVDDNSASLTVDDGGGSITVDGSVTVSSSIPAGSNNIGTVDINSLPAADRSTDTIAATLSSDGIATGSLAASSLSIKTPKFKVASVAASSTDSSVIASVASKKLRILSAYIMCGSTATDITFESDDPTTDTTVWKATLSANGGVVLPFSPLGWFETDAGEALIATTSAGSTVQINLTYIEV